MNDPILNSYGYVFNDKFITYSQIENLKYPKQTQIQSKFTEIESFFHELGPTHVNFVWPLSNKGTNENGGGDKHDYSKDYLTFTAIEDTTFKFSVNALQYSLDDGATWTTLPAKTASSVVTAGNKILWKQTGLTPTSSNGIGTFSATGNFNVSGNIMSLYYGDDFVGQTDLTGKNYVFYRLFHQCDKLVSAENLILPATTLASFCYGSMFQGCTSLTTAPELPATTLASSCYGSMFFGCTSLTNAPELPATTLANSCYSSMFRGCTSLTSAPELPATTLANYCYSDMFSGCTSLVTAPELPATTLADSCYQNMFTGCSSLEYLKILYTGIGSPGTMDTVSSEGDLYLYSQQLASNNDFLKGFNGWRLYVNDVYSGIIDIHGGGCGCGCGC